MNVSRRLFVAVLPAILGVFTVAGLAYWGEYGRQAPHVLVIIAVVASVASLSAAWRNTRYVATRITRLAASARTPRIDELDAVEDEVARLRLAVHAGEAERARLQTAAQASVRTYAELVADAATATARQLDEIRMPLHILLENRFGDLNENQEEMLAAARAAADDAQASLERIREIADVERGAIRLRAERVRPDDIVAALVPGLVADGARSGVTVRADVAPLLSPVVADRARLSEAISLLAADAVRRTAAGGEVRIVVSDADAPPTDPPPPAGHAATAASPGANAASPAGVSAVRLVLYHGRGPSRRADTVLADRLIAALGGSVHHDPERTIVTLLRQVAPGPQAAGGRPAVDVPINGMA